ncbi:MAG: nucleoside kinase, partial [bacterium]
IRTVLIGGPSSSGKTTFTKRLTNQLKINGLNPLILSLDNYYFEVENPLDDKNYTAKIESPRAINIEQLNKDIKNLYHGKTVKIPKFNFKTGKQISGHLCKLKPDNPILIEGMHALNDNVTITIPKKKKFKIYVSALTQLNITNHVRIPTSDIRLLRRMLRGYNFRNQSLSNTFHQWPNVKKGEEKFIFPFQENADVIFNSALVYEPAVFRSVLKPLLDEISNDKYIYSEAQRLIQLLYFFVPLEPDIIPLNSILREFIGGSIFNY